MKPIPLIKSMLVATAVVVASCSAPKLAQHSTNQDDVYASTATAKEYVVQEKQEAAPREVVENDEYYGVNNPYYDMDYASRINRFYYGNTWRSYYDNFYSASYYPFYNSRYYLPFGYNPYYSGWRNPYYGIYSYYGYYNPYGFGYQPYWGGGYYGGGYYGGGYYGVILGGGGGIIAGYPSGNTIYNGRPERGRENGVRFDPNNPNSRPNGNSPVTGRPDRATLPGNQNNMPTNNNYGRPTRSTDAQNRPTTPPPASRPTRSNEQPSRPVYTPPPAQSAPPQRSSSSGSESRGSSNGSSGRPTRGGGI